MPNTSETLSLQPRRLTTILAIAGLVAVSSAGPVANASAGSVPHRPQAGSLPALDASMVTAPLAVEADGSGGAHRWRTDPELRRALHAGTDPNPRREGP